MNLTRLCRFVLFQEPDHIAEAFPAIRARFEEAYGKTRIMGNPPGYQLDSNFHHHLANGTNSTDWIFIYEIAMNKKITDWLVNTASLR